MIKYLLNFRVLQIFLDLWIILNRVINWITLKLLLLLLPLLLCLLSLLVRHSAKMVSHELRELSHKLPELRIIAVFLHCFLWILSKICECLHVLWILECFEEFWVLSQLLKKLRRQPILLRLLIIRIHRLLHLLKFQILFLALSLHMRLIFHFNFLFLLFDLGGRRLLLLWRLCIQETCCKSSEAAILLLFFLSWGRLGRLCLFWGAGCLGLWLTDLTLGIEIVVIIFWGEA